MCMKRVHILDFNYPGDIKLQWLNVYALVTNANDFVFM